MRISETMNAKVVEYHPMIVRQFQQFFTLSIMKITKNIKAFCSNILFSGIFKGHESRLQKNRDNYGTIVIIAYTWTTNIKSALGKEKYLYV